MNQNKDVTKDEEAEKEYIKQKHENSKWRRTFRYVLQFHQTIQAVVILHQITMKEKVSSPSKNGASHEGIK